MRKINHSAVGIATSVLILLTAGCNRETYRFEEGVAWNTVYHITYDSPFDLGDSISAVLKEIDFSLSPFNETSTVSRINANLDSTADSHLARVYAESLKIHRESEGMFDPTIAPLIRAWGFGQGHEIQADTLRIDSLLALCGIEKTRLEGTTLLKEDPRIEFNFSALAKGYGVDCVGEMLERNGVRNYLVEIGGEIRTRGLNPKGKRWGIGIDRPEAGANPGETVMTIYVDDAGIATSGNYRNYQEADSGIIGHTISPRTGRPVATDVISATVIAPTCMEADALATCCMAIGSEKALNLCTRMRAGVLLIKRDMTVVTNPAFNAQTAEPGTADRD